MVLLIYLLWTVGLLIKVLEASPSRIFRPYCRWKTREFPPSKKHICLKLIIWNAFQINDDIAEVLYYSNNKCEEALSKLLTKERLNVAAVSKVLLKGKSLWVTPKVTNHKVDSGQGPYFYCHEKCHFTWHRHFRWQNYIELIVSHYRKELTISEFLNFPL